MKYTACVNRYTLFSTLLLFFFSQLFSSSALGQTFYKGVDLSYVNQMEDHGGVYSENGVAKDPYQIMSDHGANLVRIRLWHTPNWTDFNGVVNEYSNFEDAKRSIARAKAFGMQVLLDFHYSDTWADPSHQKRPAAWNDANNTRELANRLYNYTYQTLRDLDSVGLMPEMVQIGNETNHNMCLGEGEASTPVDFRRQAKLLNAGIQATKDAGSAGSLTPKTVIHIANPAHIMNWFTDAEKGGLKGYDIIGVSYYYNWHGYSIQQTADVIAQAKAQFQKDVMIVEISHPWTTAGADSANNIINESAPGYPAPSPEVQRDYMVDVSNAVADAGGLGVIYWEPAWISTDAYTQWGHGSHWENQTFFDFNGNLLVPGGIEFLSKDYPTTTSNVTFKVDMAGVNTSNGVYVTGHFSGAGDWNIIPMTLDSGTVYTYTTQIPVGSEGAYYFLNDNNWNARETVPSACATWWGVDRGYVIPEQNATFAFKWSSCEAIAN